MTTKQTTIVRTSREEMKNILSENNTNQFISMVSKTPQDMNKFLDYWLIIEGSKRKNPNPTINPYMESGIYKEQYKIDVLTGFGDYENIIVNRLRKEGKTEEEVQNFINRHEIKRTETIQRMREEGKTEEEIQEYLDRPQRENWWRQISNSLVTDTKTERKFYLRYVYTERTHSHPDTFTFEGNEVEREVFEGFLTKKNTEGYSSQGLDHTFNIQFCDLDNIVELTMNGTKYILTN